MGRFTISILPGMGLSPENMPIELFIILQQIPMFNIKREARHLFDEYDKTYSEYLINAHSLYVDYEKELDEINFLIDRINMTREAARHPLKRLTEFLDSIGNGICELTIFDFCDEDHYCAKLFDDIPKCQKPILEETHFFLDPLAKTMAINGKNSNALSEFKAEISLEQIKYESDIQSRKAAISAIKTAHEVAELYKNTIIAIKDTIEEDIIPMFNYTLAFLYADDIREKLMDDSPLENIIPHNIIEYKNTAYNGHYLFVHNAHDFYLELSEFFSSKVLTKLLSNKDVKEEDLVLFKDQANTIRNSVLNIKALKVNYER